MIIYIELCDANSVVVPSVEDVYASTALVPIISHNIDHEL